VIGHAVLAMALGMPVKRVTKLQEWLYDLVWEVVRVHAGTSLDPPLLPTSAGLFL
jgi:hypothetical protein